MKQGNDYTDETCLSTPMDLTLMPELNTAGSTGKSVGNKPLLDRDFPKSLLPVPPVNPMEDLNETND